MSKFNFFSLSYYQLKKEPIEKKKEYLEDSLLLEENNSLDKNKISVL